MTEIKTSQAGIQNTTSKGQKCSVFSSGTAGQGMLTAVHKNIIAAPALVKKTV